MLASLRIPIGWTDILKRTVNESFFKDDIVGMAAQLAYYFFLALFPALLFFVALASYLPLENVVEDIVRSMSRFAPPDVLQIVRDQLHKIAAGEQGGLLTVGMVLTLWSTSAGMVAIINTLNKAYDIDEGRPWWKVRLTAIGLTIALALFILVSFFLVIAGPPLAERVANWVGLGPVFVWTWWILQWPLVFALVVTAIALVYYFAPDAEQSFVWLTPGAVLATVLWLLFSIGFRIYVVNFGDYNATYGALGGVIVLLLWFYASGLAILIGAEMNAEIEHASPYGKDPGEKVPGQKRKLGALAERAWKERRRKHAAAPALAPAQSAVAPPREPVGPGVLRPSAPPPRPARRPRPRDMVIGGLIAGALEALRGRRVRE